MPADTSHLSTSVLTVARRDVTTLFVGYTIQQALDAIREIGPREAIVYFYVVDEENRLVGVVPVRRLLTARLEERIADVMVERVIAIPESSTVLDACEIFVLHKYLAFPVVDAERRVVGVVDIGVFTDEVFDIARRDQMDRAFESLGFTISQVADATPLRAFRYRFPWLAATIASGTLCALLAGLFEATLAEAIVLSFFLTLVLGLGESVSIQSMTVTIQELRTQLPTLAWYLRQFRRESVTALLLGIASGSVVGCIVWFWRGDLMAALSIGTSIVLTLLAACLFGLSVPTFLHARGLDPKIAAGPVTLALADLVTVFCYLTVATILL